MADQHRIDKAFALLKSLASPCEGDEHQWRKCDLAVFITHYEALRDRHQRAMATSNKARCVLAKGLHAEALALLRAILDAEQEAQ